VLPRCRAHRRGSRVPSRAASRQQGSGPG
jgi:hypothetical protein